MLETEKTPGTDAHAPAGPEHAGPAPHDGLRWRLVAAVAAGAALVHACGGRAQDFADEDADGPGQAGERATGSSQTGQAGARSMPRPGVRPPSTPREQAAAAAPRDGEICYSPSAFADAPGISSILPLLPDDALDDNGCLTSEYSGWANGGGCSYDPRPAVVRGELCCHLLSASFPACGRPFIVGGAARTAPVCTSEAWLLGSLRELSTGSLRALSIGSLRELSPGSPPPGAHALGSPSVDSPSARSARAAERPLSRSLARRIGSEWLTDARLEHASVGSFASFALSLLAVGAPPELLAACQRAGLDEVEHARACFALASRFIGENLGPGPLSLSGVAVVTALDELAARTWLDGCVEETVAALTAAAQLEVARDEAVRAALGRIAADEARHAELAWSFVAWALASGGAGVRRALAVARDQLDPSRFDASRRADDTLPDPGSLEQLHAHGRLSDEERRLIRANAWHEVIRPALDALLAVGEPPAGSERATPPAS